MQSELLLVDRHEETIVKELNLNPNTNPKYYTFMFLFFILRCLDVQPLHGEW